MGVRVGVGGGGGGFGNVSAWPASSFLTSTSSSPASALTPHHHHHPQHPQHHQQQPQHHQLPTTSRVVTPESSPSTPTHFTSAWTDRLPPHPHTFHTHEDPSPLKDESHDLLSVHSAEKEEGGGGMGGGIGGGVGGGGVHALTRSNPSHHRHLPPLATSGSSSRRRSSSHGTGGGAGGTADDRQLDVLLKSIRLSVAKMDELLQSTSSSSSSSSPSLSSTASTADPTPTTSPVLGAASGVGVGVGVTLQDIKALLVNAANAVTVKKRKSLDEGGGGGGMDSPLKRRLTTQKEEEAEDEEGGGVGGDGEGGMDGHFSIQEVKQKGGGSGVSGGGDASHALTEEESEDEEDDEGVLMDDEDSPRTSCKPCPLVESISKKPLKVLYVNVQRQYTVSKKETVKMSKEEKERLVPVHVRIMGTPARESSLYFVAKDVCLLIHTRKGNVAKSIGQFKEDEKVRMSVVCPRSNGTVSTHILTALTLKGVKRLLTTSRSPLAQHVLKWILKQVDAITQEWQEERRLKLLRKTQQHAAAISTAAPNSQTASPVTGSGRKLRDAERSAGGLSAKTSPTTSPASSIPLSQLLAPVVPLAPLSPSGLQPSTPLSTDAPSILKPAPVAYKGGAPPSASQQLSVMVREQMLGAADKKSQSMPSSPNIHPTPSSTSTPSTPTSAGVGVGAMSSPAQVTRSAFSKVPAFTDADRKLEGGGGGEGTTSPTKRLSPVAKAIPPPSVSALTPPSSSPMVDTPSLPAMAQPEAKTVGDAPAPAAGAEKGKSPSLTTLLEAINVQRVDK